MFDVGFSELLLTGVVALVVLGPERLPKVARTAGLWAGRARRFLANVKADIDREMKAEELRQIIDKQAKSTGVHEIVEQTRTAIEEITTRTSEAVAPVAAASQNANDAVRAAAIAAPQATPAAAPLPDAVVTASEPAKAPVSPPSGEKTPSP